MYDVINKGKNRELINYDEKLNDEKTMVNAVLILISHWGLCTYLLALTLQLRETSAKRPSDEGCVTCRRFKWGSLPPNEVGLIHQRWGRKGRREG